MSKGIDGTLVVMSQRAYQHPMQDQSLEKHIRET